MFDRLFRGPVLEPLEPRLLLDGGAQVVVYPAPPGSPIPESAAYAVTVNGQDLAVYADEGSSYILIEKNLLHHTSSECLNLHYGRENVVRNNVLAFSGLGVVSLSAAGDWNSMTLERNIILAHDRPVLVPRDTDTLAQRGFRSDLNCFWDLAGAVFAGDEVRDEMARVTWRRYDVDALRAIGYDRHSVVADPGFADPASGDFTLPADSPALAVGFEPFTAAGVGVGEPASDARAGA